MSNLPYIVLADTAVSATTAGEAPAAAPAQAPAGETTATTVQPTGEAGQQAPAEAPSPLTSLLPFVLIFALFYFMMIRPQQRKEKERRKMIDELRAGARVVFAGGIVGTIVEATEKSFRVETAPGNEMEILRSCVQGVVEAEGSAK